MLRIKEVRKKKNITAKELADYINVAESTMSLYENGKREPDFNTLLKISNYLETSIDYLLGKNDIPYASSTKGIQIPVVGRVAAGLPISAVEDILDFEEIHPNMAKDGSEYIALKIKGDSMEPKISKGDVVIVRVQPTCETGDIAIVFINGDEATCKKIKKTPEGVTLISLNPTYEPMFYTNKEIEHLPIRIFGKVVELRAKF